MYAYVQHPSYTAVVIIITANTFLLERQDGIVACWMPGYIVHAKNFWELVLLGAVVTASRLLWMRIGDEEAMLKRTFGKEWEVYHARTKRFVPWVV
jgi:protein-S-isoprenylcysteine O-methyltransferase Ste14